MCSTNIQAMESMAHDPLSLSTPPLHLGSTGTTRLTIPPDPFRGLAAVFPQGIRAGSALALSGAQGSGISRFCYELLAWWSLSCGFCVLVDLTKKVSPTAVASTRADLRRLFVFRPNAQHSTERFASALGALIDGFPLTVVIAPPGAVKEWVVRKAQARAASRGAVISFATIGGGEPRLAPVRVTLSCKKWLSDSFGILVERRIEANVVEYGASRAISLKERVGSPRLDVASEESWGALHPVASKGIASRHRSGRRFESRPYLEVAASGS